MTAETKSKLLAGIYRGVERLGVPTMYLGVMTWLLTQAGVWCGDNVIKPIVTNTLQVQSELTANSRDQTKLLAEMKELQRQHADILIELQKQLSRGLDKIEQAGL